MSLAFNYQDHIRKTLDTAPTELWSAGITFSEMFILSARLGHSHFFSVLVLVRALHYKLFSFYFLI